jgi:hypothetical protein
MIMRKSFMHETGELKMPDRTGLLQVQSQHNIDRNVCNEHAVSRISRNGVHSFWTLEGRL